MTAPLRHRGSGLDPEAGEASVEFIGFFVVLVVPLIYFILMLSQLQATVFAAESGAHVAARTLARDPNAQEVAIKQINMAFSDHGISAPDVIDLGCTVCSGQRRDVSVTVSTRVSWPLVPSGWSVGSVPVSSTVTLLVDQVVFE